MEPTALPTRPFAGGPRRRTAAPATRRVPHDERVVPPHATRLPVDTNRAHAVPVAVLPLAVLLALDFARPSPTLAFYPFTFISSSKRGPTGIFYPGPCASSVPNRRCTCEPVHSVDIHSPSWYLRLEPLVTLAKPQSFLKVARVFCSPIIMCPSMKFILEVFAVAIEPSGHVCFLNLFLLLLPLAFIPSRPFRPSSYLYDTRVPALAHAFLNLPVRMPFGKRTRPSFRTPRSSTSPHIHPHFSSSSEV